MSPMSATTAEAVAMPPAPGPTSVIGEIIGVDRDRIGDAHHLRDGGVFRHHGQVHALLAPSVLTDPEQLHAVAELVGPGEVLGGDRGNAFHVDGALLDLGAEGEAGQDRELLRRIMTFNVEGGVGLGVAEPLRLLQAVGKGKLLLLHARQDVIAGAVEDAVDARQRIARQALAQGLYDRDGAADPRPSRAPRRSSRQAPRA